MGLLSWLLGPSQEEKEEEYYKDLYRYHYGKEPKGKLTKEEKEDLDWEEFNEEEEWDEDDGEA